MAGKGFLFVRAKIKILNLVALSFLGTESIRNASRVSQNIQTGSSRSGRFWMQSKGTNPVSYFFIPRKPVIKIVIFS